MIKLPAFELLKKQPDPPHVARTVVRRSVTNAYGAPIEFVVQQSRKGTEWWIFAVYSGQRMSNTLHTAVAAKGQEWIAAVTAGEVCIEGDDFECTTCLGHGRIRDGVTRELRRCLNCAGTGLGSVP